LRDSIPTLWQLEVSHFSEKARWALDYKEVEHRRRTPVPGAHMPVAALLTRGEFKTFPILQIEGRTIGDSSSVIAAIEQRYPEPPLYPADPAQRRHALELEDYFDEELGPHTRLLAFHEIGRDRDAFERLMAETAPGPLAKTPGMAAMYGRLFTGLRFGVHDEAAAGTAREGILAALGRLERELGDDEYLVGDSFSVADLTAASLFFPIVLPAEGPVPASVPPARGIAEFREPLQDRRGYRYVEEMFRRHRFPAKVGASAE
jgi:glutathione S-transferase